MKVKNGERKELGLAPAYGEGEFQSKAEELRNIAYAHTDQL